MVAGAGRGDVSRTRVIAKGAEGFVASEHVVEVAYVKEAAGEEAYTADLTRSDGKTVKLKMPALKPGSYSFVGEYHEATAQGRIVAE